MPRTKKAILETRAKEAVLNLAERIVQDEEAKEERVPGKIVNGQKTPWTRKDVARIFPIVEFTPDETVPVTYNGVMYQLIADQTCSVPSIVKEIFERHKRRERAIGRTLAFDGIQVRPGAGGLQPNTQ